MGKVRNVVSPRLLVVGLEVDEVEQIAAKLWMQFGGRS